MIRFLNVLLLIVALVGIVQCYLVRAKIDTFRARFVELENKLGLMGFENEDQFSVHRIKTDDPEVFVWRIHTPVSHQGLIACRICDSTITYPFQDPAGIVLQKNGARARFVAFRFKINDTRIGPSFRTMYGAASSTSDHVKRAQFLKKHWTKLEFVDPTGGTTLTAINNEPIVLCDIKIPETLWAEFRDAYTESEVLTVKCRDRSLIQVYCGEKNGFSAKKLNDEQFEESQRDKLKDE